VRGKGGGSLRVGSSSGVYREGLLPPEGQRWSKERRFTGVFPWRDGNNGGSYQRDREGREREREREALEFGPGGHILVHETHSWATTIFYLEKRKRGKILYILW